MDFSVIIPAKNEESNITRCLESIFNADAEGLKFEVLVIDNGSSDGTTVIARGLGAFVYVLPDATISGLRNFGAAKARGKVLAFIDADCSVAKDWFLRARQYLGAEGVACFGAPPGVPENATWVQKAWFKVREKGFSVGDTEWLESMNMFVPRDVFRNLKGFDESLVTCEDYDLSLRLKKAGRIISDSRIMAVHHGEAANLRHFLKKERWRGRGNLRGLLNHGFHWREIPSLVLPLFYGLFFMLAIGLLFWLLAGGASRAAMALAALVIIWQLPILFLAFWKCRGEGGSLTLQLALLLNLFFCARGLGQIKAP